MSRLYDELKRRNVVRVGVAYLVVGWVIAQIVDTIAEPLSLPDWFATVVIVLLGVGFPVALILAWAFELTPEGLKRSDEVDPAASIAPRTGRTLNYVTAAALVVALGYIAWDAGRGPAADPNAERSIAVLPFRDLSPAGDQAWFGDGVADAVLHDLSQSGDLKVISRSSSFAFRDTAHIPTVAATLGARFVLEGSVTRDRDRVRVIAQLIDGETDAHVWSETYDRDLDDIFAVQTEIASQIARALNVSIGARRDVAPPSLRTYDLILQAKSEQTDRTPEGIYRSIALLEDAVGADPGSADALGELAMARLLSLYWDTDMTAPRAQALTAGADSAAAAALARNPTDVEALVVAGALETRRYEFERADSLFRRALAVSPGSALVYNWYGDLFQMWNRGEDALAMEAKAAELDPLQPANHLNLGMAYEIVGDPEGAEASYRRVLELSPAFGRRDPLTLLYRRGEFQEMTSMARAEPDPEARRAHLRAIAILRSLDGGELERAREAAREWMDEGSDAGTNWIERLLLLTGQRDLWAELQPPELPVLPWGGWQLQTDPDTLAAHPGYAAFMRTPPRDKLLEARGHWVEDADAPR
jgi:TolB-like protein